MFIRFFKEFRESFSRQYARDILRSVNIKEVTPRERTKLIFSLIFSSDEYKKRQILANSRAICILAVFFPLFSFVLYGLSVYGPNAEINATIFSYFVPEYIFTFILVVYILLAFPFGWHLGTKLAQKKLALQLWSKPQNSSNN